MNNKTQNRRAPSFRKLKHDLRSPLTAILGYTVLLLNERYGNVSGDQERILNLVLSETKKLDQMISETFADQGE